MRAGMKLSDQSGNAESGGGGGGGGDAADSCCLEGRRDDHIPDRLTSGEMLLDMP
jgi:hypothetical protein